MHNSYNILPCGRAVIYINGGGRERATLIDAADLPRVIAFPGRWYAQHRRWTWYVAGTTGRGDTKRTIRLHRYLMDAPEGLEVDHIDHDGLHNCRRNLRLVEGDFNRQAAREWGEGRDIGYRWYEAGCGDPFGEVLELLI